MRSKVFVFIAIAALFTALGAFVGMRQSTPAAAEALAAKTLIAQTLNDAKGQPQSLSQWQGKTLVVNFWATWCPPCVEEMPELSALQEEISHGNVHVLGIGIDSPGNIAEFAAKHKIAYPLYVAGMNGTEISRQFGNQSGGLPFTVLIGRDGQVKKTYLGRLKMEDLRRDLADLQ